MSPYKRGDVVMLHFPFKEDPTKTKFRPAVVLEDEDDPIFALIQCTSTNRSDKLKGLWVIKDSPEGRIMGILKDTFINVSNVVRLNRYAIYRKIGVCPLMDEIDELLNQ